MGGYGRKGGQIATDFRTLSPQDSLRHAVELLLRGSQQDFPVIEDGRVVGGATPANLLVSLAQGRIDSPVGDVMCRKFEKVDAAEMLKTAFQRFQTCHCETMLILRAGALVGLVSLDNVGEFVAIQAALESAQASRA